MADPTVVGEDQDFFHIQTPSGQVIPVAKGAFDPAMLSQDSSPAPSPAQAPGPDSLGGFSAPPARPADPVDIKAAQAGDPMMPGASPQDAMKGPMLAGQPQGPAGQAEHPGAPGAAPASGAVDPSQLALAPKAGGPDYLQGQPQFMKDMQTGMDQEKAGLQAQAKVGQQKAAADFNAIKSYDDTMKGFQAKAAQDAAAQEEALNKQMSVVTQAQDDVAKHTAIDPNHYWNDKSTGGKIAASIGLILGGMAGGMNGTGHNPVMDVIQKAIDRDIDSQKANLQAKQNNLSNQTNLLGQMRQNFSSMRDAQTAAQMVSYKNVELQLQKVAAQYQGQEVGARAQQALGQLQQKQTELGMQLRMSLAQQQAIFGASGGGQGGGIDNPNFLPKEMAAKAVRMPNGKFQVAATEEGAKEINKVMPAVNDMQDTLKEVQKLRDQVGSGALPFSTASAQAQSLISRLIFQNQKVEGLNRLSDPDIKLLQAQIPDAGSWRGEKFNALMNGLQNHLSSVQDNLYSQHIPNYKRVSFTPGK
jgi:hypothetical protein